MVLVRTAYAGRALLLRVERVLPNGTNRALNLGLNLVLLRGAHAALAGLARAADQLHVRGPLLHRNLELGKGFFISASFIIIIWRLT